MKKILGILGAIILTTTATTNIVACSTQTFDKTYETDKKYFAFWNSNLNYYQMNILEDDVKPTNFCLLLISQDIYNKFQEKLRNFVTKSDNEFTYAEGTIKKVKFTYSTEKIKMGDGSIKDGYNLKELDDIQGIRTN